MELKLQQAIVATRAGQIEIAQSLLTQLIREEPEDANAWFLLSYLVDSPDRQILYLQKTLELDSENEIARHYLAQLQNDLVPAPMIWQGEKNGAVSTDVDEQEAELATATPALEDASGNDETRLDNKNQLPQNLDQKQLGSDSPDNNRWSNRAGLPQREFSNTVQETREQQALQTKVTNEKSKGEVWLVRILIIMVILAAIVLGFLVLLILIQP